MKPRLWIVLVSLFLATAGGGLLALKLYIEKKGNLSRVVDKYVKPLLMGSFSVSRVKIGFFSVYLEDVSLSIPLQSVSLKVPTIKIGFSAWKFISSRGKLPPRLDNVIVVNPRIEILFPPAGSKGAFKNKIPADLFKNLPVKQILIKNGQLLLIDRFNPHQVILRESLDGRLWEEGEGVYCELNREKRFSRRVLNVYGAFLPDTQYFSIQCAKMSISKPIQLDSCTVIGGIIGGFFRYSSGIRDSVDLLNMAGMFSLKRGAIRIGNRPEIINDVEAQVRLSHDTLIVDSVAAAWFGMRLAGQGSMSVGADGDFDFHCRIDRINLARLSGIPSSVRKHISGIGTSNLSFSRRGSKGEIVARCELKGFLIDGIQPGRLYLTTTIMRDTARIDSVNVVWNGVTALGKGTSAWDTAGVSWRLSFLANGYPDRFVKQSAGRVVCNGTISGNNGMFAADMQLNGHDIKYGTIALGSVQASTSLRDSTLHINSCTLNDSLLSISGIVQPGGSGKFFYNLNVASRSVAVEELVRLYSKDKVALPAETIACTGRVTGTGQAVRFNGSVVISGNDISGKAAVACRYDPQNELFFWQLTSDKMAKVKAVSFPITASGRANLSALYIDSVLLYPGILGKGSINLKNGTIGQGEVDIASYPLASVDSLLLGNKRLFGKGKVSAHAAISGTCFRPKLSGYLNLSNISFQGIDSLSASLQFRFDSAFYAAYPFAVSRGSRQLIHVDSLRYSDRLDLFANFSNVPVDGFTKSISEPFTIGGMISGSIGTTGDGLPCLVNLFSDSITVGPMKIDSVKARILVLREGIAVDSVTVRDGTSSLFSAHAFFPYPFLSSTQSEQDTAQIRFAGKGDLLQTFQKIIPGLIRGTGFGTVEADLRIGPDSWYFKTARCQIENATVSVDPYIPDKMKQVSLVATIDRSLKLNAVVRGTIDKRPFSFTTQHSIPVGFMPVLLGPIDCGLIQVQTPQRGVNICVYGLMPRNTRADVDFLGKSPFSLFTISGPIDRLRLTGTWVIRSAEITYPTVYDHLSESTDMSASGLFPLVDWDMDMKAGSNKVVYYYDIGGKKRDLVRFIECTIDPGSTFNLRGREADGNFKIYGSLRSYKGYAFYGKTFDRNFEFGLDFEPLKLKGSDGYSNQPIIWGSVEAFADTNRLNRIKLILVTQDKITGGYREKGRLNNISFRVSAPYADLPTEEQVRFYKEAGLQFTTIRGAGGLVSSFSDQYINRYFLQTIEKRVARQIGVDVLSFETSLTSNYFNYLYNNSDFQNHFTNLKNQWNYLLLANIGFTVGKYFMRDKFFLKWRTDLVPRTTSIETPEKTDLRPEYSIGLEYQPIRFFWVDLNYSMYRETKVYMFDPKLYMYLRIPF